MRSSGSRSGTGPRKDDEWVRDIDREQERARRNYVRLGGMRLPTISQPVATAIVVSDGGGGERQKYILGYCCFSSLLFLFFIFLQLPFYFRFFLFPIFSFFFIFCFSYQKLRIQNVLVCLLLRNFAARRVRDRIFYRKLKKIIYKIKRYKLT